MPNAAGDIGYGATLGYSDTENGVYTEVGNLTDVMPPAITSTRVDKTSHSSADATREKSAGLIDPGEIEFKILFDEDEVSALYDLIRLPKWWRVEYPLADGDTTPANWKCQGHLADISAMVPLDDKMEASLKVCLSGKPTFNAAA